MGTPTDCCSVMVVRAKKDGSPRRTVDFQYLNSQCKWETHHTASQFHLACEIPLIPGRQSFDHIHYWMRKVLLSLHSSRLACIWRHLHWAIWWNHSGLLTKSQNHWLHSVIWWRHQNSFLAYIWLSDPMRSKWCHIQWIQIPILSKSNLAVNHNRLRCLPFSMLDARPNPSQAHVPGFGW